MCFLMTLQKEIGSSVQGIGGSKPTGAESSEVGVLSSTHSSPWLSGQAGQEGLSASDQQPQAHSPITALNNVQGAGER